tara:strand:- start:1596 stop:1835 length:240 start_codon:yes stop_codon:yes gene_type:complete
VACGGVARSQQSAFEIANGVGAAIRSGSPPRMSRSKVLIRSFERVRMLIFMTLDTASGMVVTSLSVASSTEHPSTFFRG